MIRANGTRAHLSDVPDPEALLMPIGPLELTIVLVLALVILGPKRLPDAGRSLGRGLREFKESVSLGGDDDARRAEIAAAERDR